MTRVARVLAAAVALFISVEACSSTVRSAPAPKDAAPVEAERARWPYVVAAAAGVAAAVALVFAFVIVPEVADDAGEAAARSGGNDGGGDGGISL